MTYFEIGKTVKNLGLGQEFVLRGEDDKKYTIVYSSSKGVFMLYKHDNIGGSVPVESSENITDIMEAAESMWLDVEGVKNIKY